MTATPVSDFLRVFETGVAEYGKLSPKKIPPQNLSLNQPFYTFATLSYKRIRKHPIDTKTMTHQLSMTEAELVAACMRDDRIAQRELYDRYKKAMYTLAYRTTGDFAVAEDVLQEAFIKIFRSLKTFRGESTVGAWIKTIVVRTAYSKLRKKKIFTESLDNQHLEQQVDWGHNRLDAEYLEKAIAALPEGYRMVFTLIEVEGYAHKEVAAMLDISVGTSKSQLFHAKKRLRESLKAFGY